MKITARLAAAGLLAAMALGATTLPADATVTKTAVQTRAANPNHVLPTEQAEAWWTYQQEIGENDGCWGDFSGTYLGLRSATLKASDLHDGMMLDSILHPGFVFVWGPYDEGCDLN